MPNKRYSEVNPSNASSAHKKGPPTLNDDGRESGSSYRQDGKQFSDAKEFVGSGEVDVLGAKEVVDPNAGLKAIHHVEGAED